MMIELEKYQSGQELDDVVRLLEINDFEYEIENIIPDFDPSFSGKRPLELFSLKVKRSDISQINELLTSEAAKFDYNRIPSDYYLMQFTNEELLDVLLKPDEWSREDYRLSQLILEKGKGNYRRYAPKDERQEVRLPATTRKIRHRLYLVA